MMKNFLVLFLLLSPLTINAQDANKFSVNLGLGAIVGTDFGLLATIEPNYTLSASSSVGLRLSGAAVVLGRSIEIPAGSNFDFNTSGFSVVAVVVTYDKYLGKTGNRFQPFIGGGLGYYKANDEEEVLNIDDIGGGPLTAKVSGQLGFLLRTGLEFGGFRFGLEYNIISAADFTLPSGDVIGQANDSYFGLSLGYVVGR